MKKVLLISGSLPPIRCGVGYYSLRLINELAKNGADFSVISTAGIDTRLPVAVTSIANWKIGSVPKLISYIKQSGAEIIHIQYPAVGYSRNVGINLLPYLLRMFLPKKRIAVTLHEYHGSRLRGRIRNLITILPAHTIIVSNPVDKKSLPTLVSKKAVVIPIGANFDKVKKNPAIYKRVLAKAGLVPNKPTLHYFGFAFPAKRLELALQAMGSEYLKNYQLLLLTSLNDDNPYQNELISKIDDLNNASAKVGVTGFLADAELSAVLQEGKYFLQPQKEPINGKSGTVITALTHGLILVASGSGKDGGTEPFVDRLNCRLPYPLTGDSIAQAIDQLEQDSQLRLKIMAGAKELSEYFSWGNIIKRHLELYETI